MQKDILIVGAMKMEIAGIKGAVHTGFGKERTRYRLNEILKEKTPSLVISAGVVGSVIPELKAGDVFIPEFIVDYEKQDFKIGTHPIFSRKMGCVPILKGTLVTVPHVFERHHKYELKKLFPDATAVDMETSAVAEVLEHLGIPLLCIKGVCDELDFDFNDKKTLSKNIILAIKSYTEYLWKNFPQLKK